MADNMKNLVSGEDPEFTRRQFLVGASVTKGDSSNPTVAPSVWSNLTTILGRTAAYQKREVTWTEMMNTNEKLEADLKGLKT